LKFLKAITFQIDYIRIQEIHQMLNQNFLLLPGYIGSGTGTSDHDMYWVGKNVDLRSFKLAIGAKTIWKYRVRVYKSLEEFIGSQNKENNSFTQRDLELIQEMRKAPAAQHAA
jgi:hypothetical protein